MFKTLSNESLVKIYLTANEQRLDQSFLQLLLDEIQKRGIYDSLFETSVNCKSSNK
ncbi:sporulation histidine kinase inhibitor Sda [Neobacillus cucumis]|uniref:sporulation histidine kinase inhibitor Sda n=1 Tax=Neobacillus cucumis TaxID=1740721 RepID=UPI002E1FBDB5|nr:sporulation histidine kinase inhibitor Sda [Neobacillus cucumis]